MVTPTERTHIQASTMGAYTGILVALLLEVTFLPTYAILGYDCGGGNLNITTISLFNTMDCNSSLPDTKEESTSIQLLQLSEYKHTMVRQCLVEVDRFIFRCGMLSHMSPVPDGHRVYIEELSRESCDRLHNDHEIHLYHNYLTQLQVNATETRSILIAGKIEKDGSCEGTEYSDHYGNWDKAVVTAVIKITLKSFRAPIKYDKNELILPGGKTCVVSKGKCRDNDGSDTYWGVAPTNTCDLDQYDTLYHGMAIKISPASDIDAPIIYTLTTKETTFALAVGKEIQVCGYKLIQTEHPKLFIMELEDGQVPNTKGPIDIENLNIFTYINSKFIYVERHIRKQMTDLYQDIMKQKCLLEQQTMANALTQIWTKPDEVAKVLMKESGYMAVPAGEVVHLVKCIPVSCAIRKEEHCYEEIPVSYQNSSLYLSPKTHILTRRGTPRDCSHILPTMFKIQEVWYKFVPHPIEAVPPRTLGPLTRSSWKYNKPSNLATSGVYTEDDIERLRDHIMSPIEKINIIHTIAQGAMGNTIPEGTISLTHLLDEDTWDKITTKAGEKFWHTVTSFGTVSAGIIGIFMIFKIIKTILDTIFQGYILHDSYGCGIHLIGALCTSLTHFVIHRANKRTRHLDVEEGPVVYAKINKNNKRVPKVKITKISEKEADTQSGCSQSLMKERRSETNDDTSTEGEWTPEKVLKRIALHHTHSREALNSSTSRDN